MICVLVMLQVSPLLLTNLQSLRNNYFPLWTITFLPFPTIPYRSLPFPTIPYHSLPFPTIPYPTPGLVLAIFILGAYTGHVGSGWLYILVVYNFGQHFFLDHRHKFETQNELNIHYITQQSSNCLEVPPSETLRNIKRKSQLLTPQGTSSWFNRCSCINSSFAWHWSYGSLCKIPTRNMPNQSSAHPIRVDSRYSSHLPGHVIHPSSNAIHPSSAFGMTSTRSKFPTSVRLLN